MKRLLCWMFGHQVVYTMTVKLFSGRQTTTAHCKRCGTEL